MKPGANRQGTARGDRPLALCLFAVGRAGFPCGRTRTGFFRWSVTFSCPGAFLLAACDPQAAIDITVRRTAAEVVEPVVARELTPPLAKAATECILQAASMPEIRALARDIGVEAGTQTKGEHPQPGPAPRRAGLFRRRGVPPVT